MVKKKSQTFQRLLKSLSIGRVLRCFKNGVKVVGLVYPNEQEVEVFTSYKQVKICTGDDICSASPVLADFEICVSDIFKEYV